MPSQAGRIEQAGTEIPGPAGRARRSMIGTHGGTPPGRFLQHQGAGTAAKYVGLEYAECDAGHITTARHPQTSMAFERSDDILPTRHGYPSKIRIPTKLCSQSPKSVTTIYVTGRRPKGFCTDCGYTWSTGN